MWKKILPVFIFVSLLFIFFLRLFYPRLSIFMIPDFGESDVLHLNLPLKYILSSSLHNHQWPLWTPYLANGFPILAEGQIGTFYLPNLLLFRFLPLIWAYNLNLGIAFLLAAFGTYLFTRKLGLSTIASFFASFIFTFSGFLAVHLNHFNLIQSASLLPLLFWSATLLWDKPSLRFSVLFSFLLSEQIFSGHFYIVFITLVGIAIYLIALCITTTHCSMVVMFKKVYYFLLSFVFAFLLSAIQLLPTIELWQLSSRQTGLDFDTVTSYPFQMKNFLTFIAPYAFGDPARGTYPPFSASWGIFWENTGYMGLLPIFLAITSIIFLKNKRIRIFWVLLLSSLFLVLGKNSPFYFIFAIFPFNLFRVPSKFLLLTTFSLSILSAFVSDQLLHLIKRTKVLALPQIKAIAFICGGAFLLLVAVDEYKFSYNYPPVTPADWWMTPPGMTQIIKPGDRISSAAAPILWNSIFEKSGWHDFAPYVYFNNSLYPNYNALFAIGQADINTGGLIPRRVSLFTSIAKNIDVDTDKKDASASSATISVLNLAGVNFIISPYKLENNSFVYKTSVSPPGNLKLAPFLVYRNSDALPRSYLTYNTKKIATVEEFYSELEDTNFSQKHIALVEDDRLNLSNPVNKISTADIVSSKPTEVILRGESDKEAVLVLSDTNYPGWKAYLDGKPVKIYPVNLVFRGILFPAGRHTVKFIYDPLSFDLGKRITILGWIIISLVVSRCFSFSPRKVSGSRKPSLDPGNKLHNR